VTGVNIRAFPAFLQGRGELLRATSGGGALDIDRLFLPIVTRVTE